MKAEDTVMSDEELETLLDIEFKYTFSGHVEEYRMIAKAQAEISFKMGYNQALRDIKSGLLPADMV